MSAYRQRSLGIITAFIVTCAGISPSTTGVVVDEILFLSRFCIRRVGTMFRPSNFGGAAAPLSIRILSCTQSAAMPGYGHRQPKRVFVSQTMMDSIHPIPPKQSHRVLLFIGAPFILITSLVAWRIVWEETFLSLERGPQMIGFSMAHGPFVIFLLAPLAVLVWLIPMIIATIASLWQRKPLSSLFWTTLTLAITTLVLLALPPAFWQYVMIERFAKSPHAVEFMTEDAAEGYARTVGAYIDHGVCVDARGEYGTAASAAAVGGSVEVLKLLRYRHANLNTIDSSGKSPLSDAIEMKRSAATLYLKSQGALEIKPPPPTPIHADETVTR